MKLDIINFIPYSIDECSDCYGYGNFKFNNMIIWIQNNDIIEMPHHLYDIY